MDGIETLKQWVMDSDNIVFFGGAGVSTESGIPDFRSVDGLYNQKYDYPPETILSHSFYMRKKEEVTKKFEAIYVYANQRYHEDTGNSFYQGLAGKAQALSLQLDSAVVFEEPELLAIGEDTIELLSLIHISEPTRPY